MIPTRRTAGSDSSVSAQSLIPATAVGTAVAIPTAISRSAALAPDRGARTSTSDADVSEPIAKSVSNGCSGWPSQVPLSASLTGPAGSQSRTLAAAALAGRSSRLNPSSALTLDWTASGVLTRRAIPRDGPVHTYI